MNVLTAALDEARKGSASAAGRGSAALSTDNSAATQVITQTTTRSWASRVTDSGQTRTSHGFSVTQSTTALLPREGPRQASSEPSPANGAAAARSAASAAPARPRGNTTGVAGEVVASNAQYGSWNVFANENPNAFAAKIHQAEGRELYRTASVDFELIATVPKKTELGDPVAQNAAQARALRSDFGTIAEQGFVGAPSPLSGKNIASAVLTIRDPATGESQNHRLLGISGADRNIPSSTRADWARNLSAGHSNVELAQKPAEFGPLVPYQGRLRYQDFRGHTNERNTDSEYKILGSALAKVDAARASRPDAQLEVALSIYTDLPPCMSCGEVASGFAKHLARTSDLDVAVSIFSPTRGNARDRATTMLPGLPLPLPSGPLTEFKVPRFIRGEPVPSGEGYSVGRPTPQKSVPPHLDGRADGKTRPGPSAPVDARGEPVRFDAARLQRPAQGAALAQGAAQGKAGPRLPAQGATHAARAGSGALSQGGSGALSQAGSGALSRAGSSAPQLNKRNAGDAS